MKKTQDYLDLSGQLFGPLPGPANEASRNALSCLLGSASVPSKWSSDAVESVIAYTSVLELRRKRMQQFLAAGWRVRSQHALEFCPPSGFKLSNALYRRRRCANTRVCPFCWCRKYVVGTYKRIAAQRENFPKHRLVEVRTFRGFPRERYSAEDVMAMLRGPARASFMDQCCWQNYGYHQNYTVEATPSGKGWSFSQRAIFISPSKENGPDWEILRDPACIGSLEDPNPEYFERVFAVHEMEDVTDSRLAAIVGRVCQYPEYLLTGDLDMTIELLDAWGYLSKEKPSRVRMYENTGGFRKNPRKDKRD